MAASPRPKVSSLTPSGHAASFFVAMHATDPLQTCYTRSVILALGVRPYEAARVHHTTLRCGGNLAARGSRGTIRSAAACRRAARARRERSGMAASLRGVQAEITRIGLDRGAQPRLRVPLR